MKLIQNIKASYDELMNKVSWPTWQELMNSAVVVLTASIIIALIIFGMDQVFKLLMNGIYQAVY